MTTVRAARRVALMAEGKWIPGLVASTPVGEAARVALRTRLEVVREQMPRALREADQDTEYVHQLRVGTRRAVAALDLFSCCFPAKTFKRVRKKLRRLRRAAGAARDWDVFTQTVASRRSKGPGNDFLFGYARGQRAAAQAELAATEAEFPDGFGLFEQEVLGSVREPAANGTGELIEVARPAISELLHAFQDAATANLDGYEQLHRVRIAGKRLRYAMEISAHCFPATLRDEMYPAIEELQDILGRANDSRVAIEHLETLRSALKAAAPAVGHRYRPAVEGLLRYHRQRRSREAKNFRAWWQQWQASKSGQRFVELLRGPSPEEPRLTPSDSAR